MGRNRQTNKVFEASFALQEAREAMFSLPPENRAELVDEVALNGLKFSEAAYSCIAGERRRHGHKSPASRQTMSDAMIASQGRIAARLDFDQFDETV